MFAVCLRYSRNHEEAEEILQEGFLQVFRSLKNYRNTGSFEGWIRKIMVNCAIQHYRRHSKIYPVISLENTSEDIHDDEVYTELQRKDLLKMVQDLPPAYRMVFNLYVFEGMKHREIADLLGITEGTSKSNLHDAKRILQKAVTQSLQVAKQHCMNE